MRYLGIDYGEKHIGIAVSDETGTLAFPFDTFSNSKTLIDDIKKVVEEKGVGGIVMGESKDFQGKENPIMEKARVFAKVLGEATGLPVFFEPEFMTSVEARRFQGGGEKTHSSASALILKSFLERKNNKI